MLSSIKKILGFGPEVDFVKLIADGAVVLDVRTKNEFAGGHITGALNIPLNHLNDHIQKLPDKEKVIITCCASGMRSASAERLLRDQGYLNVVNGGGWTSLKGKIS